MDPTNDTAEEAQAGGIALPSIPRTLPPGWRQRDAQPDWTVKFASPWFDGNHWAEGRLVTKLPSQQFIGDGLRLRWKWWGKRFFKKEDVRKDSLKDMELKKAGYIKYVKDKLKHKHNIKAEASTSDPEG